MKKNEKNARFCAHHPRRADRPVALRSHTAAITTTSFEIRCVAERGKPYIFGKEGPDSYDCSGLTKVAYSHFGYDLIHSAQFVAYDHTYETVEDANDLHVGDMIFFDTISDKDKCDHVGIWLGGNRFVHASSSKKVVMVSRFDKEWKSKYSWGKRLVDNYGFGRFENITELIKPEEKTGTK